MQAKSLNFDAARIFVPHPIQDRNLSELQTLADNAIEGILAMVVKS